MLVNIDAGYVVQALKSHGCAQIIHCTTLAAERPFRWHVVQGGVVYNKGHADNYGKSTQRITCTVGLSHKYS